MSNNILLINPAIHQASQNKVINAVINKTIPTSIGILAGYLRGAGIGPPRLVDEQIDFIKNEELEKKILVLQPPRIIGMSVLTINSKRAYMLADAIKAIDPKATIILGGIHPTVVPDEVLKNKNIDVVVRGEGEKTLKELVDLITNEKDYSQVQGISIRRNGNIIHNLDRPLIMELDEIPAYPFDLFEKNLEQYSNFGAVFTSRGCPYKCIFCSSRSVSGKRYRYFSVDRVLSEIKILVDKYHIKSIMFLDDNIAVNKKYFTSLLDAIIAADLHRKVNFNGSMRGDNVNHKILEKAKAANFMMIAFGLETGSESLMKLIGKGETVEQVAEAIRMTDQKGIAAATTIIFGLPTETRKDRWDAIKLVRSLPLSSVRFNTLSPYPGTPVYEMLNSADKVLFKEDWENFAVQYMWEGDDIPYVPDGNNRYELIFDTMFANFSYYLRINGIKRMLKSSFAGGNVINLSDRWYLSPKTMWRLTMLFLYLSRRFSMVTLKMITKQER
jgi:radical SAM superfamily enzyme YgiQ (UPF0313 family)